LQKKDAVHVATVGRIPTASSALGQLLYHLVELQDEGHIELKAKLAPGPAHPELIKAADFPEPPVLNKPMHAVVDVFLLEKAILADGQDASQLKDKKHSRGSRLHSKVSNTWHANARHMAPVLNWMLQTASEGLQIGPDSDGLLNFCDSTASVSSAVSQPQAEAELLQDASEGTNGLLAVADHAAEDSQGPSHAQGQSGAAPVTVQQMLDSVALPDDAPRAVAPSALRTVPKQFQLQGLYWMLARERQGDALGRLALISVCFQLLLFCGSVPITYATCCSIISGVFPLFCNNCMTNACLACTFLNFCNTCVPERGPHSIWQL